MKPVVIYRAFMISMLFCLIAVILAPWMSTNLMYFFKTNSILVFMSGVIATPSISLLLSVIIGKFRKE